MAGVAKHPESKYWTAIFYDGAGMKRRRSTKQSDRRKALKIAMEWEELAKAGREKRLTEAQARRVVSDILEDATGERLSFFSAKDWFAEWLASKRGTVDPDTVKRHKQVLDGFLEHLGQRAELTIAGVTTKDVRTYRDVVAKSVAASTANQTIKKFLSAPFFAAMKQGFITVNPCAAVISLRDDVDATRDTFTGEQISALLKAAEEEWKGVIIAGYFSGLRLRDITNLTWDAVDLKTSVLNIVPGKTRRFKTTLVIPLHPDFAAWLNRQTRGIGKAPIFPSLAGLGTGGKTGLSGRFAAIMAKAKVQGRQLRGADGHGRKMMSLSFHSLRHSFNSAMANAGVSKELRMKLTGHADEKSHAIYTHLEIETLRTAMSKVPALA